MTHILIVEDEESLSEPLAFILQREGYQVTVAEDGPGAVAAFDKTGADLVLLDLMLPGIPGTEVCRIIRTKSQVPIVMLTAKDSEVDIVVGLELGADDCVTCPTRCSRRGRSAWTSSGTSCRSAAPTSPCP
jgi:two-component system response regulator RegX3